MSRSSRRGPWLPEEDATLLHLVRTQGPNNWVRISQHMQHRSPKQCRERYHQNLKPTLNHEPISPQEGEIIEQLVQEMGKRWAEIARRLGNRSDNAVKNWWNGSMNRRKRNTVPQSSGSKIVGYRPHPIPATAPPSQPRQHIYRHEQPTPSLFPVSHLHQVETSPSSTLGSQFSRAEQQYSVPPPAERYQTQGHLGHYSLSQSTVNRPPFSTSHSLPVPSTIPSPGVNTLPRIHTWSTSQTEYQLPPLNCAEAPAPSPALTENSHTSNQQAPSLVSDNQSTYSISPKTITSPRPGMTSSKMPPMHLWLDMQRRNSTGNYPDAEVERCEKQRSEIDVMAPRSANSADPTFPRIFPPSELLRPLSLPETTGFSAGTARAHTLSPPSGRMNLATERDNRMNVSRLLE